MFILRIFKNNVIKISGFKVLWYFISEIHTLNKGSYLN